MLGERLRLHPFGAKADEPRRFRLDVGSAEGAKAKRRRPNQGT